MILPSFALRRLSLNSLPSPYTVRYRWAMTTKAPDFTDGYPSNGKMIGPLWQFLWDRLGVETEFVTSNKLVGMAFRHMEKVYGVEVADKTTRNLLLSARKRGLLVSHYKRASRPARDLAHYARVDRVASGDVTWEGPQS